jgi:hypothetical protein
MSKSTKYSFLLFGALTMSSVVSARYANADTTPLNKENFNFTVEEAPEWTALFKRDSGWFGGDGIFALPLNGKEDTSPTDTTINLIWFSDTMIGEVENNTPKSSTMIHNSLALLRGAVPENKNIQFYWDTKDNKAATIFEPRTPSAKEGDYYWLGDGFLNKAKQNTTYIFAYRMHNTSEDDWSFKVMGINLIEIPAGGKPPFKDHRQIETPFSSFTNAGEEVSLGAGILANTPEQGAPHPDGFIYVYGVKGKNKSLIAGRIEPENFESFDKWEFWTGSKWSNDFKKASAITTGVSNELSVTPMSDGKYILVYQENGMSSHVIMRVAPSPVGPFSDPIVLYDCPEVKENKNYFVYNAKAHPSLSKAGELLISYNVNSFNFFSELKKNATLYRPRFIRVKFK